MAREPDLLLQLSHHVDKLLTMESRFSLLSLLCFWSFFAFFLSFEAGLPCCQLTSETVLQSFEIFLAFCFALVVFRLNCFQLGQMFSYQCHHFKFEISAVLDEVFPQCSYRVLNSMVPPTPALLLCLVTASPHCLVCTLSLGVFWPSHSHSAGCSDFLLRSRLTSPFLSVFCLSPRT